MDNWWDAINSIEKKIDGMKYEDAINYLESEIHNTDDTEILAIYLFERAYLKLKKSLSNEGLLDLNRALEWILDMENSELKGYLLIRIGNLYLRTGEIYAAMDTFKDASKNFSENSKEYIEILNGMGEAYKRMEDIEKALLFYKEAYTRSKEIGYTDVEFLSAKNIAEVYSLKGDKSNAEIWLDRAFNAAEKEGDEGIRTYLKLCRAMLEGDIEKVRELAEILKNKAVPFPYMVADAFYYYSNFISKDLKGDILREALLIYSDIGDGNMRDYCIKKLSKSTGEMPEF